MLDQFLHKICFRSRAIANGSFGRKLWWSSQGARFGSGTRVPQLHMTWPHQVSIGSKCRLENNIYFKFDGIWQPGPSIIIGNNVFIGQGCEFNIRQRISIADHCLIASGCKFIDHDHGTEIGLPMNMQQGPEAPITLAEDVWLGCNVVVLKGISIGKGAIVGAGAVVTKSIPPLEVWGGVPAKRMGKRQQAARLLPEADALP